MQILFYFLSLPLYNIIFISTLYLKIYVRWKILYFDIHILYTNDIKLFFLISSFD